MREIIMSDPKPKPKPPNPKPKPPDPGEYVKGGGKK